MPKSLPPIPVDQMASKSTKKDGKKDDELPAASMAALAKLLAEHKTALSAEFKSALTSLETKLDGVQAAISDHGQRLTSLEDNANQISDRFEEVEAKYTALEDNFAKLKAKTIDLESRSRRNNIRIAGVPESVEGTQPTTFLSKLLLEVFGDEVLSSPPEFDRAHIALTAKLPSGKPRLVIARIHNYRVKERIVQEARKRRGKLHYQGNPVAIFEDYCPEIMEQRTAYQEVMSALYQRGFKPSLLYPAKLRITIEDGGRKHFASVKDAENFLASQR